MPDTETIERPAVEELRSALTEQGDRIREMRSLPEDERSDNWTRELRDSAHLIYALDAELREAEIRAGGAGNNSLNPYGRPTGSGPASTGANVGGAKAEHRSIGAQVVENTNFTDWCKRNHGSGTSPSIEVRAPSIIAGDPYLLGEGSYLDPNGSSGLWTPRGTPYLPMSSVDQRRLFIRDVIAGGSTTLSAIPYIRELNPRVYEEGAQTVAEGTPKAEVTIQFSQDLAPVRKIGAWVPVTTEILEDAPTLQSYINARLGYMIRVREEEQVLNGSGNGADLRGITQTPNIQAISATVNTTMQIAGDFAATMGNAIGLVESVDGDADGIALNPVDFWTMVTTRHASYLDGQAFGTGTNAGMPFGPAPATVWGLPAVRSRSMAVGQALIGAWKTGVQLFDRTAASIRVGDQHADYFTSNKVAVLIEERLALAVYRPDWFVLAQLH